MKIGIFGCTADPFTEAHQAIVSKVLCEHVVDRVIIAPTIVDYYREGKMSWLTNEEKLDLINTRLTNDPEIRKLPNLMRGYWNVLDDDFKLKEICYGLEQLEEKYIKQHRFIDTLIDIIKRNEWNYCGEKKNNEYYVIIGSDSYWNFKSWTMHDEIVKLAKLIVVTGRDDVRLPDPSLKYPPFTELKIDKKFADVSATKIRAEWRDKGYKAYKEHVIESFVKKPSKELLLHTPIFDVVKSEEVSAGFRPIQIKAPDWVAFLVEKDGQLLVENQFRYGSNSNIEEFPCGMVEEGEDPLDASIRELEEETGYKISNKNDVVKLGATSPNPAFMTNTMHYFYVNLDVARYDTVPQKLDEHEKLTFSWKDKDQFVSSLADNAYRENGNVVPAIALAMVQLYEKHMQKCS